MLEEKIGSKTSKYRAFETTRSYVDEIWENYPTLLGVYVNRTETRKTANKNNE